MDKIAIPQLDETVAPRFEAARRFLLVSADGGQVRSSTDLECGGSEGYHRVRLLQIHDVTVLICNGINGAFRDMLSGSGIAVVSNVCGTVDHVLGRYLEGRLVSHEVAEENGVGRCEVPHKELVESARSLFESNGYTVEPGPGPDTFLVDLVAVITCPVCGRPVRVAICCGAHTYRADQEIAEFHHATPSGYNARVYVSPASTQIITCCREYGIELVEPGADGVGSGQPPERRIPLLRGPVIDHQEASRGTTI